MDKDQIAKLEMLVATEDILNQYTSVWGSIPKISESKNTLSQWVMSIKDTALDQGSTEILMGKSLRGMKKDISEKLDMLDDILEAYAEDTSNQELIEQASNTMNDYFRLDNGAFEAKAKVVIGLLEAFLPHLADYGLTGDLLEDVKNSFGEFEVKLGKPRSYKIESRIASANLDAQFDEAMATVSRLDKLLKRFKRSNAAFYHAYEASRVVV